MSDNLLAYKLVPFINKMATDKNSHAHDYLSVWRPDLPEGWFYLGQSASTDWSTVPNGLIVKALAPDVLKDVTDWEQVWNDEGSHNSEDFSLWHGIPPNSDYVVLGGIFSTKKGWPKPSGDQTWGIKAIRKDVLGLFFNNPDASGLDMLMQLWTDQGTHAKRYGSVWMMLGNMDPNYVFPLTIVPAGSDNDWDAPPGDWCWMLTRSKVLDMTNYSAQPAEHNVPKPREGLRSLKPGDDPLQLEPTAEALKQDH